MKVREIMVADIATGSPQSTLQEIAAMMRDEDVGAIPIIDEGELSGIITDRDIVIRCIAEGKDPSESLVEDVLSEELATVEPEAGIEEASRLMAEKQIRRLPVVDNGKLVGMISIGDLAVKQGDERLSGEALEDVSQGVKPSRSKQAAAKGRKNAQGISNADRRREEKRQSRVVSIGKEAKLPASPVRKSESQRFAGTRRRKAS